MSQLQHDAFQSLYISSLRIREGVVESLHKSSRLNSLIYIASGNGQLVSKEQRFFVTEGKSYCVTEESFLTASSSNLLSVYQLSWDKRNEMLSPLLTVPLADQLPAKVVPLWEEASSLQNGTLFSERCRFQTAVWQLLSILTDHKEVDGVAEAMTIIQNQLSTPYSVADLAAKAGMTPASFSRAFRKKAGMSPKEFLNEERMKAAKALMIQNKGMTTKDVAWQVGLQDEFYFSRLFKRKEGMAPSVYMKRSKERIAVVSQLFLQDYLLALGIQPVAAPAYPSAFPLSKGVPAYLEKELEGTRLLNGEKMFQPEEILQTNPDRIIKTPLHHDHMQSILFTHQQKVQIISLQTEWNAYLRELSTIIGKESKVDQIERDIHLLECKVKEEVRSMTVRGNWAVIWIRPEEIRLYGKRRHACLDLIYEKLEFEPHPDLPEEGYRVVTVEQLADLNFDKLLILWSYEQDVWRIAHTKEWKRIKAVEQKEVYYPKSHEWDSWGPIGRKHMLLQFSSALQNGKLLF